ncbi:MAG TPA: HAMP domain-containing sensor histidine kinase, partial [Myxococcaceae bacterium]|nr:HAMP domain-containing sensor histidine kinase [Myxococcaceae bacterium]
IVSHDLRSPLSTITMGAAQLIADARGSEHGAMAVKIADRIGRASQRMNHMIRDLLDFASIEAGRLSIHVAVHDVDALIAESLEQLQPIAADEGLRLERQGVLSGVEVRCDRERVLQVFSNLIGNAVKFTGAGGTITVSTRQEKGRLVFGVADTGPGIAPEDLPHLFDRYWQAKAGTRMGLGLGLAISKAIVESHGGDIWVESTLGRGTVFYFSLPLAS